MERDKQLELLFEYTKFHIGLYLTLAAAYITIGTAGVGKLPKLNHYFVWLGVVSIAIAGFAGGVIASSITQTTKSNVSEFLEDPTGPWCLKSLKGLTWTYIEHTMFWVGVICVILSFAFPETIISSTAAGVK